MKIAVSGSSGLVGRALCPVLVSLGHEVRKMVRRAPGAVDQIRWDPNGGNLEPAEWEGCEAIIHLAGENIAARRWSAVQKERIRSSRVDGTRRLVEGLLQLERPPTAFVCASAIGYYGDRGEEVMTEQSPPGSGFLADTCQAWEAAAEPLARRGCRVVHLRLGVVLSPRGGALAKMLPPFMLGAGGVIGDGQQYCSWISLDDVVGTLQFCIDNASLSGAVNGVAPHPVTNHELTKTLGKVVKRPTLLPMPAFAARMAFGELAEALLLASTRVEPKRLLESGYPFRHPHLEGALRHLLGRPV